MKEHQRKEEYVEDQKNKRKKLAKKIFASFTLRQKRFLLLMPFFIANGIVYAIYSPFDMVT